MTCLRHSAFKLNHLEIQPHQETIVNWTSLQHRLNPKCDEIFGRKYVAMR